MFDMAITLASLAAGDVEFKVAITSGRFTDRLLGCGAEGGTAEIGVNDDACGIYNPVERGCCLLNDVLLGGCKDLVGAGESVSVVVQDFLAQRIKGVAQGFRGEITAVIGVQIGRFD